ncbi:serine O-acetyltransferase [Escherichia coli]|uniref:serine O-acetyltransferase n=1 Tax=Escherichia coli TaxID=562 RepID=UPI001CDAF233|nr:serine acetyltransferase [Escherichia coli]MDA6206903.1 serine acetyltransferase [Escherichia coli]MDO2599189.1 serine acetyltransferase [Escherichia coli]
MSDSFQKVSAKMISKNTKKKWNIKRLFFHLNVRWRVFLEYYYSYRYYRLFKIPIANHLTIGLKKLGEKNTIFPHPVGIVIGKKVSIGNNCTIYQNVTIGVSNNKTEDYPIIGDNVIIYAGAIIIGSVSIGNNVIIGAGCIVTKDVPEDKIAVGSPMKIIDKKANVLY